MPLPSGERSYTLISNERLTDEVTRFLSLKVMQDARFFTKEVIRHMKRSFSLALTRLMPETSYRTFLMNMLQSSY